MHRAKARVSGTLVQLWNALHSLPTLTSENKGDFPVQYPKPTHTQKETGVLLIRTLGIHELPRNPVNSQPQPEAGINYTGTIPFPTGKYRHYATEGNHQMCVCVCLCELCL